MSSLLGTVVSSCGSICQAVSPHTQQSNAVSVRLYPLAPLALPKSMPWSYVTVAEERRLREARQAEQPARPDADYLKDDESASGKLLSLTAAPAAKKPRKSVHHDKRLAMVQSLCHTALYYIALQASGMACGSSASCHRSCMPVKCIGGAPILCRLVLLCND